MCLCMHNDHKMQKVDSSTSTVIAAETLRVKEQ